MKIKKSGTSIAFDIVNCCFMCVIMLIMLYPIVNVMAVSLSSSDAINAGRVSWLPVGMNLHGYEVVMSNSEIWGAYKNTVIYAALGTVITLFFTSLAAYTLVIKEFVFRQFFTAMLVVTMFFNGGLIPTYLILRDLHLINTLWVMVLPGCISAYNVFVFRTFFAELSGELREASCIDGANDLQIWYRIFLPLSKPLLATFALFTIVAHWNGWFNALMYLEDGKKYPLQMILRKIVILDDVRGGAYADGKAAAIMESMNVNPKNVQMASIMIAMIPVLCVYPFVQKYFVKGMMIGSVKG